VNTRSEPLSGDQWWKDPPARGWPLGVLSLSTMSEITSRLTTALADRYTNRPREYVGMKSLDALIAYLRGAPQPFVIPAGRRVDRVGR